MHLTKTSIDRLPLPSSGQAFYRDDKRKGLAVRVTSGGAKSFVLEKRVGGRVRRMTLGRHGEISIETAWKNAQKLLGQIADGLDPAAERRKVSSAAITLDDVLRDYLEQRRLKPGTTAEYTRAVETAFADWRTRPLNTVTRDVVLRRFKKLHDEHGPAWANLAMRILRALFNYAAHKYADEDGQSPFAANPVRVLSQTRGWAKVQRRRNTIKPHEMPAWYASVQELTNTTVRDYLLLLIFTGLRRREAARLRWQDVDLKAGTLTVPDTKNGRPHTLPLPQFILAVLNDRSAGAEGAFVFEGAGAAGYLDSPRKAKAKVVEASGVSFTFHDLRRTFATVAESLDIAGYTLKRLLNHADGSDVTAGYVNASVDRLREPMEKVANYLASAMGIDGRVTSLDAPRLHATR